MPANHPNPLAALRRFARPGPARERCELCGTELPPDHDHLAEPAARRLVCACTPCAILFGHREGAKFRRVPRRVEQLTGLRLTDAQWAEFGLPVGLAFLLHSTAAGGVVSVYPGPAGVVEGVLPSGAWEGLVAENPGLRDLEPDVEALLVNRVGSARDHFRVGIDQCYRLTGIIRSHWHGLSGGDAVWDEVGRFFATLKRRAGGVVSE